MKNSQKDFSKQLFNKRINSINNLTSTNKDPLLKSNDIANFSNFSSIDPKNSKVSIPLDKTVFKGFFNKNFDLTKYKKERDDSRSRSRSPKPKYQPHKIRGNGIPENILDRIKFLGNIFKEEKFQKYYSMRPSKKKKFAEISDYIISYGKTHTELEAVMMVFYFVCHEIKYDSNPNLNNKNRNKVEFIYQKGKANSLGFTIIFEYFLKKLEIKYKHIEGYCKLLPKNNNIYKPPITIKLKKNENSKEKNNSNKDKKFQKSVSQNKIFNKNIKIDTLSSFDIKKNENTNSKVSIFTEKNFFKKDLINHCWNAVYIKGEWYFVDVLFGSGGTEVEENNGVLKPKNNRNAEDIDYKFNPFYFMTLPKYLILTHRPSEDNWQFTEKTYTMAQFLTKKYYDIAQFYRGLYQYNIELLTHDNPIIKLTDKESLEVKLRLKNSVLESDLYNLNTKEKITELKYSVDDKTNVFSFEPNFPQNGEYLLRINTRSLKSTDLLYWPVLDYIVKIYDDSKFIKNKSLNHLLVNRRIIREQEDNNLNTINNKVILPKLHNAYSQTFYQPKIINDYSKVFSTRTNKKICYDNEGFILLEPKTAYIKKGNNIKFKMKIHGAFGVYILDGNKWYNLKKTEKDVYEGTKEIKTDNVSICCLREKKIFTEVFRFKTTKEKSMDIKLLTIRVKKNRK